MRLRLTGRIPGALPGLDHLVATFDPAGARPGACSLTITVRPQDSGSEGTAAIPCEIR